MYLCVYQQHSLSVRPNPCLCSSIQLFSLYNCFSVFVCLFVCMCVCCWHQHSHQCFVFVMCICLRCWQSTLVATTFTFWIDSANSAGGLLWQGTRLHGSWMNSPRNRSLANRSRFQAHETHTHIRTHIRWRLLGGWMSVLPTRLAPRTFLPA